MNRRITFVSRGDEMRDWESADSTATRVICVEPLKVLTFALTAIEEPLDIERVILDGAANATEYLELLASLREDVTADVLMIRNDGTAFLSAMARAGSRVLYALGSADVDFYLQAHGLVVYERIIRLSA